MSIDEFAEQTSAFRQNPGRILCLECREGVTPVGVESPNVTPHFAHAQQRGDLDELDDCSLAKRSSRLRWFGEEERDRARGMQLREAFFDEATVKAAYALCLSFVGTGNLPIQKFGELIDRADRLGIWDYVGLECWCVPHILLLLADFGVGTNRPCHFVLVRAASIGSIWRNPAPVSIQKLFSDTMRPVREIAGSPNPRPILKADLEEVKANWIKVETAKKLVAFGSRQRRSR